VKSTLSRLLLALMMFTMLSVATAGTGNATTVSDYCATSVDQEFLTLINRYRAQHGLSALAMSQTLGAAAEHHALDMAKTGTLAHTLSDGTDWLQNIINHGYPYGYRSENIAWGYGSAQAVFDAWKASSTHNSTMLNGGFGAIGISRVYDANTRYGYYWVTTFGSQLDTAAKSCSGSVQPTATSIPATATPTKAAPTATATKVPPTATATPIPATSTPTNVAPTATQVPPTATNVPATTVPPTATSTAVPPTLVEVPAAPSQLTLTIKPRFVQLSWKDNANNESGYRVYRSTDGGATWSVLADGLPANTTRFKDNNPVLQNGRTANYVVTAYNANGESQPSASESAAVKAKR
jgi:uncharacterized protein YkwD